MVDEQALKLEAFGKGRSAPSADLAAMHRELLPTSPAVRLGKGFLEGFYYGVLPAEGLIFGQVAYLDDRPVAFIVATADSNGFLSTAIRRRWASLGGLLLRHPPRPTEAWKALRVAVGRRGEDERDLGEILSLGVRTPAQGGAASSKVRRTLPRTLLDRALAELGDRPVIALVDETNTSARLLYGSLAWTVSGTVTAGWAVPQLIYRSPTAGASALGSASTSA